MAFLRASSPTCYRSVCTLCTFLVLLVVQRDGVYEGQFSHVPYRSEFSSCTFLLFLVVQRDGVYEGQFSHVLQVSVYIVYIPRVACRTERWRIWGSPTCYRSVCTLCTFLVLLVVQRDGVYEGQFSHVLQVSVYIVYIPRVVCRTERWRIWGPVLPRGPSPWMILVTLFLFGGLFFLVQHELTAIREAFHWIWEPWTEISL
jgi:hypothetical protein